MRTVKRLWLLVWKPYIHSYVKKSMKSSMVTFLVVFILWWLFSFAVFTSGSDGPGLCFFLNIPASVMVVDYSPHRMLPLRELAIPITIMAMTYAISLVCVIEGIRGIQKLYSVIKNKIKSPENIPHSCTHTANKNVDEFT